MINTSNGKFGSIDGCEVDYFTVSSLNGISFTVINYGATLIKVSCPDKHGCNEEITLNYSTLQDLRKNHGTYYGCIAGRVANRIAKGIFEIDGIVHSLAINNGSNHLHGGLNGYDQKIWNAKIFHEHEKNCAGVELSYTSIDGEEGYPGQLEVCVRYELKANNQLVITYKATTTKATPINLTNHTYWNLSGNCKTRIYDHTLQLSCTKYLPVPNDGSQIPTGELRDTIHTLFDFSTPRVLRDAVLGLDMDGTGRAGLDHCYVVDGALDSSTGQYQYDSTTVLRAWETNNKHDYLRHVATLSDPVSGRRLVLHATQPGVQIYSANWLDNSNLTDHKNQTDQSHHPNFPHIMHNGLCLETQHFPDTVNQAQSNPFFPSVILRPESEPYFHQAVYTFDVISS